MIYENLGPSAQTLPKLLQFEEKMRKNLKNSVILNETL